VPSHEHHEDEDDEHEQEEDQVVAVESRRKFNSATGEQQLNCARSDHWAEIVCATMLLCAGQIGAFLERRFFLLLSRTKQREVPTHQDAWCLASS